jgi:hypothetical protein
LYNVCITTGCRVVQLIFERCRSDERVSEQGFEEREQGTRVFVG